MTTKPLQGIQIVKNTFAWFNETAAAGREVVFAEVQKYFTDDAEMIANNRLKCRGIEAHVRHFHDLTRKMKTVQIQPFDLIVDSPDRAAGYYRINFRDVDGVSGTVFDMAIWDFRDGKIARMTEIVHFEGTQVELEDF